MDSLHLQLSLIPERPLTIQELCEFLQCARSTIDQYNREGLPRFYIGKELRYLLSKVISWLERRSSHKVTPPEETFDPRKELKQ